METPYYPINCDYHDVLETLATLGRPAEVKFLDVEGTLQVRRTPIIDVYARSGAEFLVLATGDTLRLDRIVAVDGTSIGKVT